MDAAWTKVRITVVILAATLFALAGVVAAYAQFASDSGGLWCLNSCCFYGVTVYNTDGATPSFQGDYAYTSTASSCATSMECHGYFWDPSISDFQQVYSGFLPGTHQDCAYGLAPTTNAYGYHQIYFQGFDSTTYEPHAN